MLRAVLYIRAWQVQYNNNFSCCIVILQIPARNKNWTDSKLKQMNGVEGREGDYFFSAVVAISAITF